MFTGVTGFIVLPSEDSTFSWKHLNYIIFNFTEIQSSQVEADNRNENTEKLLFIKTNNIMDNIFLIIAD